MSNIATAQAEYFNRPADERFPSLQALIDQARHDKDHSKEAEYNWKDLRVVPTATSVQLASPKGSAPMTHYAFGQVARSIGAPAGYLRSLPPAIVADAMNHGLQATPSGSTAKILLKQNGTGPVIRAATSDTYGRAWDAQLYSGLADYFGDGQVSNGGKWQTPPAWPGSLPSGNYRGDRDSFVIRVDGGSIVQDPSLATSGAFGTGAAGGGAADGLYRGLMVRNSEVGHASVTIECVLFRYICGNHMLWGAILDKKFRRRHVGNGSNIVRACLDEMASIAWAWTQRTASQDEQIIRNLIQHEVATTKEGVVDQLRKYGATKDQAEAAYATCEETEAASPRSFWGLAQGFTRNSQESGHQDERLKLDQLAAQVLKVGALVTV